MDEQRFEAMTRWMATKPSRRDALKVLVATVLVAALAPFRPQQAGAGSIIPGMPDGGATLRRRQQLLLELLPEELRTVRLSVARR